MRSIMKGLCISLFVLIVGVIACGNKELTDEKAIALAKDKYVEEQVSKAKEWGAPLASRGSMYMLIREAEVISNDGQTASVKLTIRLRPDFPSETKVIEIKNPR